MFKKILSDEDIWYSIFNEIPDLRKKYLSPVRVDHKPDCKFFYNQDVLLFYDPANPFQKVWTAKGVLRYLGYNTSGLPVRNVKVKRIPTSFKHIEIYPYLRNGESSFTREGIEYFKKLGVKRSDVENQPTKTYNIHAYSINDYLIIPKQPCFAYELNKEQSLYKIYAPNDPVKWTSNNTKNDYWFVERGSDTLLITKSNKDVLTFLNLVEFDLTCFSNEGSVPDNLLERVKGYKRIIVNNDPDKAGRAFTEVLKKLFEGLNVEELYFPITEKDCSGYILKYGKNETLNCLNNAFIR